MSAKQNFPRALVGLADFHRQGISVPKDNAKAVAYYYQAREYGDFSAMKDLQKYFRLPVAIAPVLKI